MRPVYFYFVFIPFCLTIACNNVSDTAKKVVNKGGEVVGETASDFIEGVGKGIGQSLDCKVFLDSTLIALGLENGKYSILSSPNGGENNLLTIYFIFNEDFDREIKIVAKDKNDLEIGRTSKRIKGSKGSAEYFEMEFHKRTYIEAKSNIYFKL
jgi:hypothetical protein